jgi:hypothetical protein
VVALAEITAFPLEAHGEAKLTVIGVVEGEPVEQPPVPTPLPTQTTVDILVVPKADRVPAPTPNTRLESVTGVAPTEKPYDAVTAVVPTWADAVMVVAPEVKLDAVNVIVAVPLLLVNAVPVEGVRVAKVWSATLKVTTALGTGRGVASSRVAVTVTGVPAESVLAKGVMVRVGVPVVPPVPPTDSVARFVA